MADTTHTNNSVGKVLVNCIMIFLVFAVGLGSGVLGSFLGSQMFNRNDGSATLTSTQSTKIVDEQSAIIDVVQKTNDAVVSIIVSKNLPKIQQFNTDPFSSDLPFSTPQSQNGTELKQIGAGSGFIVSADGYIVTNSHVVVDEKASYTVLLNNGEKVDGKVLARDAALDIAVLKIDKQNLSYLSYGDSSKLKIGQHVIAIGNALGEFQNTVSSGIISGLSRSITASDTAGASERLDNIIQTDASINPGNSGGPLLDYDGNVIGVNVAVAQQAENIGFALPINGVRKVIESVLKYGEIRRPYIGVRYTNITPAIAKQNNLDVDYGALVVRGSSAVEPAVIPGSPADKAGIAENDIILEVNGEKVTGSLQQLIQKYNIGDTVTLKIHSKGQDRTVELKLEQAKNQ